MGETEKLFIKNTGGKINGHVRFGYVRIVGLCTRGFVYGFFGAVIGK
jgi:hypothetical protein